MSLFHKNDKRHIAEATQKAKENRAAIGFGEDIRVEELEEHEFLRVRVEQLDRDVATAKEAYDRAYENLQAKLREHGDMRREYMKAKTTAARLKAAKERADG
jgi:hypothetical protein